MKHNIIQESTEVDNMEDPAAVPTVPLKDHPSVDAENDIQNEPFVNKGSTVPTGPFHGQGQIIVMQPKMLGLQSFKSCVASL